MLKLCIFKTEIAVSYPFVAAFVLLSFIDKTAYLSATFIAVILHELGHLVAMRILSVECSGVTFKLGNITIVSEEVDLLKKRAIIAIFGPLVNILLSLLIFCKSGFFATFGAVNAVLAAFNLLPIKGLDGGDAVLWLLSCFCGSRAELATRIMSAFTVFALLAACFGLFFYAKINISLVFVAVYLIILTFFKV